MRRIAVFGYGLMSLQVMTRLNQQQCSMVFIAKDEVEAAKITERGFEVAIIDFRNDDDLKSVGIGDSVGTIFCFYPKDADNVFLTISARAIDRNLNIIAIVDDPESAEKLLAAGANRIIDPYEICGRKTYDMLTKPDITNIMDNTVFGRHDLNMAQIEIPSGSYLEHTQANLLRLDTKHDLILLGVVDKNTGQYHFAIDDNSQPLASGDLLVVMGPTREIRHFKEEVNHVGTDKI